MTARVARVSWVDVTVAGEHYDQCVVAAQNRWSNTKKSHYGKGLLNTVSDPRRTERVGLLGEAAFGFLCNQNPDFEYHHGGDHGCDFLSCDGELKIDVKVSHRPTDTYYIYAKSGNGAPVPMLSNIYVFGSLLNDNLERRNAVVRFYGWLPRDEINTTLYRSPVPGAKHSNYEVPKNTLLDLRELQTRGILKLVGIEQEKYA